MKQNAHLANYMVFKKVNQQHQQFLTSTKKNKALDNGDYSLVSFQTFLGFRDCEILIKKIRNCDVSRISNKWFISYLKVGINLEKYQKPYLKRDF